jgi:hypothetical protein
MSDRSYQYYGQVKGVTSSYDLITIQNPGGYTFAKIHPNIVTEAMVSTQDTLPIMSASGSQLIQVFQASHDNIHQIKLIGALDNLAESTLDTFDYADDATLRTIWNTVAATKVQVYNDKTIKYEGTSSARISTTNAKATGYYIEKDLGTATDYSGVLHATVSFWYRKDSLDLHIVLRFVDSNGLSASTSLGVSALNEWTLNQYNRNTLIDDQATATDWTQIRYIRFVVTDSTEINQSAWLDDFKFATEGTNNNLSVKLYHCGSGMPTASSTIGDWTLLTSDQGNTSTNFSIKTHKGLVGQYLTITDTYGLNHIQPKLAVGAYYALVVTRLHDEIVLRGVFSSTSSPYDRGLLFSSPDFGVTLTSHNNASIRFTIYSCISCKINKIGLNFNNAPLNTKIFIAYNSGIQHCHSILTGAAYFNESCQAEPAEFMYNKDNQLGIYIEHDKASTLSYINIETEIEYVHDSTI